MEASAQSDVALGGRDMLSLFNFIPHAAVNSVLTLEIDIRAGGHYGLVVIHTALYDQQSE